jgi:hypothetical protein
MKLIRIAGLCLVAVFVMSMVAAGTASAAPHWLVCLPFVTGSTATRYTEHQCKTASGTGGWEWSELDDTEPVFSVGETITLRDTKATGGSTAVQCSHVENEGSVGPGRFDRITRVVIDLAQCHRVENTLCESVVEVKAVNLPWQTELEETENKILDRIVNVGTAGKEPGWAVTCKTLVGNKTDTCEGEGVGKEELLLMENKATKGVVEPIELLVLATFEKKRKVKCSEGGKETGEVEGSVAVLTQTGWGLRVSK